MANRGLTREGLDEEFIGSLESQLEIYGVRPDPSQPPLQETYLHVRRRQDGSGGSARLALPAFKGEKGDPGPGLLMQGDRTSAELAALREQLSRDQANWAYRNTDDNSMWVWIGTRFVIHEDAFGAKGDDGTPPIIVRGTVTVDGETLPDPMGTRVTGSDGVYSVGVDLPKLPKGDKGDPGPAGGIFTSPDITGGPEDGQILVYDDESGKMRWMSGFIGPQTLNVPSEAFGTFNAGISATRHVITSVTIPEMPYRYRLEFDGGVEVNSIVGQTIDVQVRLNDATNGAMVGAAFGSMSDVGWSHQTFHSYSSAAFTPDEVGGETSGVIQPSTEVTLHLVAVRAAGISGAWSVSGNGRSSLRVRLERV